MSLINLLSVSGTVLLTVLWVRLLVSRLWKIYPWFTAYVFSLWLESGLLLAAENRRQLYTILWMSFRLIDVLLEVKLVLAIFGQWTRSYPGIGAFGRRLVVLIMVVATALAVTTLSVGQPKASLTPVLKVALVASRATNLGFSLFLLLTLLFFWKFGGPVASNLKLHTWAMTLYVTVNAASYLLLGRLVMVGQYMLPVVSVTALLIWTVGMRPSGEIQPVIEGDPVEWEEAEEMNRQMQKLADVVTLSPRGAKKER